MSRSGEAQAIAEAVGEVIEAKDRLFAGLGMRTVEVGPGRAVLEMTVREDMLNGHEVCHGAAVFALADVAFAIAGNSHNQGALAAGATIEYVEAARRGEVLRAEAVERSLRRRTALYDVTVSGENGRLIALYRGRAHRTAAKVVPDAAAKPGEA
jgi:acyl-CoA thioesterase